MKTMLLVCILIAACANGTVESTDIQGLQCPNHPRCHPWSCVAVGANDSGSSVECEHNDNADWQCEANCGDENWGAFCPDPSDGGNNWINYCVAVCTPNYYGCIRDCMNSQTIGCVAGEPP